LAAILLIAIESLAIGWIITYIIRSNYVAPANYDPTIHDSVVQSGFPFHTSVVTLPCGSYSCAESEFKRMPLLHSDLAVYADTVFWAMPAATAGWFILRRYENHRY
jgi:hypothetical protein